MNGSAMRTMSETVYKVCVLHSNRDSFDYLKIPSNLTIGTRVWVPFRKKIRLGIIVGEGKPESSLIVLKQIDAVIDKQAIITEPILFLCRWIATYYHIALSEVLALALPKKLRLGKISTVPLGYTYQLIQNPDAFNAAQHTLKRKYKQSALLDLFAKTVLPLSLETIQKQGFSKKNIQSLLKMGLLEAIEQLNLSSYTALHQTSPPILNEEQISAVHTIKQSLSKFQCFLLEGVTGSGKTEVYLHLTAEIIKNNGQILILVPEIGLTPQLLMRFKSRFKEPIALIHSHLNDTERAESWQLAQDNLVKIIIGTRAAIFTPMPALQLIILDEEHDASFKQQDRVSYHARDCALVRAHHANIPIVLGSATPSLESLHNCALKKYTLLTLKQKALTKNPLAYQILDLRNINLQEGLAEPTIKMIAQHLENNNQVLVFINRRGFSPVLFCHACGWMADCPGCDSHLTLHAAQKKLTCHHCGFSRALMTRCAKCTSTELIPLGTGTQRLHQYLQSLFPHVQMARIDRDEIRTRPALEKILTDVSENKIQLLIGTQMLAKGHDFPHLTLVVIVDGDAGFYNHDFRALEQLGQLLIQVAGRAGRAAKSGHVLIQTHLPHHPLLKTLIQQGYPAFAQALLAARAQAALPPYYFLALIKAEDKSKTKVDAWLHTITQQLQGYSLQLLGPAPAPLARKAHYHRAQLLLKAAHRKELHKALFALREWVADNKKTNPIRWYIDVDPQDFA